MRRGPGNRQKNAADFAADVARLDRQSEALDLRVGGLTIRAIAKRLGISPAQADRDVKQAIADRPNETADEMRARANEALEAVLSGHLTAARGLMGSDQAEAGMASEKSAQVVIKAIALHAKINGYEAAEKHEHVVSAQATPAEAKRLMQEFFGGHVRAGTDKAPLEGGDEDVGGAGKGPAAP